MILHYLYSIQNTCISTKSISGWVCMSTPSLWTFWRLKYVETYIFIYLIVFLPVSVPVCVVFSVTVCVTSTTDWVVSSVILGRVVPSTGGGPVVTSADGGPVVISAAGGPVVTWTDGGPVVTSAARGPVVTSGCGDPVVMPGSVVDSTSAEFVLKNRGMKVGCYWKMMTTPVSPMPLYLFTLRSYVFPFSSTFCTKTNIPQCHIEPMPWWNFHFLLQ